MIKEMLPKLSDAIMAVYNGIEHAMQRPDFIINMASYGDSNGPICIGCAATCFFQEVFKINFKPSRIENLARRIQSIEDSVGHFVDRFNISSFEEAVDFLRLGNPGKLFNLYGLNYYSNYFDAPKITPLYGNTNLDNGGNSKEEIHRLLSELSNLYNYLISKNL